MADSLFSPRIPIKVTLASFVNSTMSVLVAGHVVSIRIKAPSLAANSTGGEIKDAQVCE